jgi:hypothetical protein
MLLRASANALFTFVGATLMLASQLGVVMLQL